ncbi:MAG TPA: F0F1 ATP synthase subunit A [Rhodothermales bacterium]|nr:F0F1 ATP synthase subunit A [Rhodothermales bacterium]
MKSNAQVGLRVWRTALALPLLLCLSSSYAYTEDPGDPDAIGHSADGFYLDFQPLGKIELPRIFLVRSADGGYRVDAFLSTHGALASGRYTLKSDYAPEAALLSVEQVHAVEEEHTHFKYPVVSAAPAEMIFIDFSITRQMVFVLLCGVILLFIGLSLAARYRKGIGAETAPQGAWQNMMESLIIFIRDEVAKPTIGDKYRKYLPYLLSVFMFILLGNLIGLLPWGVTATSGIAVTGALALITFSITQLSGSRDYWMHIFNPPGVPGFVKPIIVPVEILGLFTKPITLAVRLFANMLSGHLVIVSLLGLIFIFTAKIGTVAGWGSILVAVPMTIFIYMLKILVSIIQAYIFTMLSALYFGLAVEEHGHGAHEHEHGEAVAQLPLH